MIKITRSLFAVFTLFAAVGVTAAQSVQPEYIPSPENLAARERFENGKLGIFIHWGIYSMVGHGEWFLNLSGINRDVYSQLADGFYPSKFNAAEWVDLFKEAGAGYITFTSRHHDGFSMFGTRQSDYNIVDATPFKRDVLKELADECGRQGLRLHLYYSHLDWTRDDYPMGASGHKVGKDRSKADYDSYFRFMNAQLTELLTNYGPIGGIWFDGFWDHNGDNPKFNWREQEQYDLIHRLQPACLIANNHHDKILPGEDMQLFEKDFPGENKGGFSSGMKVAELPLETCMTTNDSWGYNILDNKWKSSDDLIRMLVGAAGRGASLLLNVGPQPSGAIPEAAANSLRGLGKWLAANGDAIYNTRRGDFPAQTWGVSTRRDDKLFVHILHPEAKMIYVPTPRKVKSAKVFGTDEKVSYRQEKEGVVLQLKEIPASVDHIVELVTD